VELARVGRARQGKRSEGQKKRTSSQVLRHGRWERRRVTRLFSQLTLTPQPKPAIAEELLDRNCRTRLRFPQRSRARIFDPWIVLLASTLSGGERRRIQMATSLESRLVGTLYCVDEAFHRGLPPAAITQPADQRFLHDLRRKRSGKPPPTILVVEGPTDPDYKLRRGWSHSSILGGPGLPGRGGGGKEKGRGRARVGARAHTTPRI